MKRLVIVHRALSNLRTGGAYYLANTISYLQSRKINMEVVDIGNLPTSIRRHRLLIVIYLCKHYWKYHQGMFHFTNHNLYFYLLVPYFLSRMRGSKYGCACHLAQYPLRKNLIMRWFEFLCEYLFLKGASLLIIPSEAATQQFKIFHLKKDKCIIINPAPNVVDTSKPRFRGHVRTLLFVGHITWRKGLDTIVKAMALLKDLKLHLEVVGIIDKNTPYWKELARTIEHYDLGKKIQFRGGLQPEELKRLYRKADIFVFPSRHETYGMVLMEAMSFGLPVVASTIPTTSEVIRDNINGILYPPEDIKALASAIRRIASDPKLRSRIIWNNKERTKSTRTWEDVGEENLSAIAYFLKD